MTFCSSGLSSVVISTVTTFCSTLVSLIFPVRAVVSCATTGLQTSSTTWVCSTGDDPQPVSQSCNRSWAYKQGGPPPANVATGMGLCRQAANNPAEDGFDGNWIVSLTPSHPTSQDLKEGINSDQHKDQCQVQRSSRCTEQSTATPFLRILLHSIQMRVRAALREHQVELVSYVLAYQRSLRSAVKLAIHKPLLPLLIKRHSADGEEPDLISARGGQVDSDRRHPIAQCNPLRDDHPSSLSSSMCSVGLFGDSRGDWWPSIRAAHSMSVKVFFSDNPLHSDQFDDQNHIANRRLFLQFSPFTISRMRHHVLLLSGCPQPLYHFSIISPPSMQPGQVAVDSSHWSSVAITVSHQRTITDPCFNLTQHRTKFGRLRVTPPKDHNERKIDRRKQALPIIYATQRTLSDKLPIDSFLGYLILNHCELVQLKTTVLRDEPPQCYQKTHHRHVYNHLFLSSALLYTACATGYGFWLNLEICGTFSQTRSPALNIVPVACLSYQSFWRSVLRQLADARHFWWSSSIFKVLSDILAGHLLWLLYVELATSLSFR
ncbi:hypothetical protein T07_5768 [Trichinella nelsoni]|uniref:Uncharacterized protein n=1 Tax=Trichinella nelsoni TaxID=6336 RepID=A0A0V0RDS9_9BILA|nr:hypothetical protein T07_10900 [Trichinella nelsoni]KRX12757.1 hypothetical protein T07_5768 [Trichinella nelsoni]